MTPAQKMTSNTGTAMSGIARAYFYTTFVAEKFSPKLGVTSEWNRSKIKNTTKSQYNYLLFVDRFRLQNKQIVP
jgi:hypothetical protein